MVIIEMENGKKIKLELDAQSAPATVKNFEELVEKHFYDGLTFHRVIEGFMIRGEFAANGFDNPIKHTRGVISMARSMHPDSAGSQFFIMHQDAPHLDGQYAAFGHVVEGMDVVDEIATTPTGLQDRPKTPQRIRTITIE